MLDIAHNGTTYINIDADEARALGVPDPVIAAAQTRAASLAKRDARRGRITLDAGDTQTILGSTADASALALVALAAHVAAVSEASGYSAYKTALTKHLAAVDAGLAKALTDLLEGVKDASVKLPPLAKGLTQAMTEIETRSTAVATVFEG